MFVISSDWECLTALEGGGDREAAGAAGQAFIEAVGRVVPSMPGPSGLFTPLGRVYLDTGQHVEFAARECACPYEFALLCEQIHALAAQATAALAAKGTRLLLTNNNHSGLFQSGSQNTWAAHENYLVWRHPREFGREILPFLTTRVYGGAGAIEYPSGALLAGVRAQSMQLDVGGSTTHDRALLSLGREEHHMGASAAGFRCHLILGDSHRSQFQRALHYGATALALRAIDFDRTLLGRLPALPSANGGNAYVKLTRRFNRLAAAGEVPRVDPLAIAVQQVYLMAARRYADSLADPPPWVGRLLDDWQATLAAFEQNDREWLAERLDPWIKHAWFTEVLRQLGHTWRDVPGNKPICSQLALLDHSYHSFCNPQSAFDLLDRAGALDHRVGEVTPLGGESEPFVPDTITRARPRARLIVEHRGRVTMIVDWSIIYDLERRRYRLLEDPFAQEFGPWQDQPLDEEAGRHRLQPVAYERAYTRRPPAELEGRLAQAFAAYERGRYDDAHALLDAVETLGGDWLESGYDNYWRFRAFVETRRGMLGSAAYLMYFQARQREDLTLATDMMFLYRFQTLGPRRELGAWVERGLALLARRPTEPCPPALHEHHAAWLLAEGREEEARDVLQRAHSSVNWQGNERVLGRALALLSETYRRLGEPGAAGAALDEAETLQTERGYEGDLADLTWLGRAKLEIDARRIKSLLNRARTVQSRTQNRMGLARTMLLEARLCPPRYRLTSQRCKQRIRRFAGRVPALAECNLLNKILARWDEWTGGGTPAAERDRFWEL